MRAGFETGLARRVNTICMVPNGQATTQGDLQPMHFALNPRTLSLICAIAPFDSYGRRAHLLAMVTCDRAALVLMFNDSNSGLIAL